MENNKRDSAIRLLSRTLKALSKVAGLPWTYENDIDVEYLVELLIDATLTELDNREGGEMTDLELRRESY